MKESYVNDTLPQKEALANELKGSLFEYLVALNLSNFLGIYSSFIDEVMKDKQKISQLQQYEAWIKDFDQVLAKQIPQLSLNTAKELLDYLEKSNLEITNIILTGKYFKGDISNRGVEDNEADLVLTSKDGHHIPISIKLCKEGSYINTKSGGVSSFLEKYFKNYPNIKFHQDLLNNTVDKSFMEMGELLYKEIDEVFEGRFDDLWRARSLPELPGQLNDQMRGIVLASYTPIRSELLKFFKNLINHQENVFEFFPKLMGFSSSEMIQVHCYHKGTNNYDFESCSIFSLKDLSFENPSIDEESTQHSHSLFEISFPTFSLQIRVKPMNKFTSKSYKVNCSLKRRSVSE